MRTIWHSLRYVLVLRPKENRILRMGDSKDPRIIQAIQDIQTHRHQRLNYWSLVAQPTSLPLSLAALIVGLVK